MQFPAQNIPGPEDEPMTYEVVPDTRSSRIAKRHEYSVDVSFESTHNFYTGFTENISSGGLFIATRGVLPDIGDRFTIEVTLPTAEIPIELHCEVRWQRLEQQDCAHSQPGVGVRFIDLDPVATTMMNEFIARRDTLFYDE